MKFVVYEKNIKSAKQFVDLMNDKKFHSMDEILEKTLVSGPTVTKWLEKIKDILEVKTEVVEITGYRKGGFYIKKNRVKKYRVKEKIEVQIMIKADQPQTIKVSAKTKEELQERLKGRMEIKKNDLVDIGIRMNFQGSVKDLIIATEEMGVKVC
ncbi:MAG: hypothetical protein JG776_476 [Caloramator sp.]|jgi:hypothetical protein|uniref:hypothetical protein n=1 Tax=Caloramator sp. TaxID=1871330 RepID=UPI001DF25D26|nr:hypothetical protein [Caloramator sp.]MBZ4662794.1 hypothetical protein [Caloramator sp.]